MTIIAQSVVVRVSRQFDMAAERVFDAWLDPNSARKWLFATPTGEMVRCDLEARVGGALNLTERRDGEDVEHIGEYLEIDRPRRLVFTFSVPKYSSVVTRVNIDIQPSQAGCELTLTHENVLPEWASQTESGWKMILEGLARNLV